jgi:hypothetical protein
MRSLARNPDALALAAAGTRPPVLVIRVPLEQKPRVYLDAQSYEDERRLRGWLSRAPVAHRIGVALDALLEAAG